MQQLKVLLSFVFTIFLYTGFTQKTITVDNFDKVIISPFIQATFVEGNEEKVEIANCSVDDKLLNIEVNGSTLRIFL